jgi:hypothetical protein
VRGRAPISLFRDNTAAFIRDLDPEALGNANSDSNYVRVQVLTPIGAISLGETVQKTRARRNTTLHSELSRRCT